MIRLRDYSIVIKNLFRPYCIYQICDTVIKDNNLVPDNGTKNLFRTNCIYQIYDTVTKGL